MMKSPTEGPHSPGKINRGGDRTNPPPIPSPDGAEHFDPGELVLAANPPPFTLSETATKHLPMLYRYISSNSESSKIRELSSPLTKQELEHRYGEYTVLELAANTHRPEVIELLAREKHVRTDTLDPFQNRNLMHFWATGHKNDGALASFKKLIELGFLVDSTDREGNTALHLAITSKMPDKSTGIPHNVTILLQNGADITIKNNNELTPKELALTIDNYDIVEIFKAYRQSSTIAPALPPPAEDPSALLEAMKRQQEARSRDLEETTRRHQEELARQQDHALGMLREQQEASARAQAESLRMLEQQQSSTTLAQREALAVQQESLRQQEEMLRTERELLQERQRMLEEEAARLRARAEEAVSDSGVSSTGPLSEEELQELHRLIETPKSKMEDIIPLLERLPSKEILYKKYGDDGLSVAQRAAKERRLDVLNHIHDNQKIILNGTDEKGNNLVHYWATSYLAKTTPEISVAKRTLDFLVGQGCDVNTRNNDGETPIFMAIEAASEAKMELDSTDPRNRDERKLHLANIAAIASNVKSLLKSKARIDIENGAEESPKDAAETKGLDTIVKILERHSSEAPEAAAEEAEPPRPAAAAAAAAGPEPTYREKHIVYSDVGVYLRIDISGKFLDKENQAPLKEKKSFSFFSRKPKDKEATPKFTDKYIGSLPANCEGVLTNKFHSMAPSQYKILFNTKDGKFHTPSITFPDLDAYELAIETIGQMKVFFAPRVTSKDHMLEPSHMFTIPAIGEMLCVAEESPVWKSLLLQNNADRASSCTLDNHLPSTLLGATDDA